MRAAQLVKKVCSDFFDKQKRYPPVYSWSQRSMAVPPLRIAGCIVIQLVEKVHPDFFDKLPAKSQNKKLHFISRFWSLRRVIEREREP